MENKKSNIIKIQLYDCSGIKNLKTQTEKNKFIIRGENFCKVYEKIKGIEYSINNDNDSTILNILFNIQSIKNICNYGKFIELIKNLIEYTNAKKEKLFWNNMRNISEKIGNGFKLDIYENKIKHKIHYLYYDNSINLNLDYICTYINNCVSIDKKNEKNVLHKKCNGGIIFDDDHTFLQTFTNSVDEYKFAHKYIIIVDTIPKSDTISNNQKFIFKNSRTLDTNIKFRGMTVIIYYPTETTLLSFINLIKNKISKPKIIWIVFSKFQIISSNIILKLLFWCDDDIAYNENIKLITLISNSETIKETNNKSIIIEKIKYSPNAYEIFLMGENISVENINLIEKIYLYNVETKIPSLIYNTDNCPICDQIFSSPTSYEFPEKNPIILEKSYLQCGHSFCPVCIITSLKVKCSCPICRNVIRLNNIFIPNIILNKLQCLFKLLCKILEKDKYKGTRILIYSYNLIYAKGLLNHFKKINNSLDSDNNKYTYSVLKNASSGINSDVLICPKDKYILCKNIKNIKNVIVLTHNQELTPESLGHDHYVMNSDIRIWLFESVVFS
jgi:hypothetical protein